MQAFNTYITNLITGIKSYEPSFDGVGPVYLDAANNIVIGEGMEKTYGGFFDGERYFYVRQLEQDLVNDIKTEVNCQPNNIIFTVPCRIVIVIKDTCAETFANNDWRTCMLSILIALKINVTNINFNTEDVFIKEWTNDFASQNIQKIKNYRAMSVDFTTCFSVQKAQTLNCYKSCLCAAV